MRRIKLIQPGLQLRLSAKFAGLAAAAMVFQFLFLGYFLIDVLADVEGPGGELAAQLPRILCAVLGASLLVVLPITIWIGALLTFRIAGPLHRMDRYLRSVARGEASGPCMLRRGDELGFLCEAVNLAHEQLAGDGADQEPEAAGAVRPEVA